MKMKLHNFVKEKLYTQITENYDVNYKAQN